MPSHIYIRDGRYHEGVLANLRSVSVDSGYTAGCHAAGIYPIAYFPHNIHFLSACATFTGDKDLAWTSALDLRSHLARDLMTMPGLSTLQHYHAFPWMVAVKLELWDQLAAEPAPDSAMVYARALWHYAQGMRRARAGDAAGARQDLAALRTAFADSTFLEMTIWGINRASSVLRVAENDMEGELLLAVGKFDAAIARFTDAVAHEDSLQYQEPPDWCFPARHELGAALLKADRAADAERVYRDDLIRWPENRFSLEGLRTALMAQGRVKEADALGARLQRAGQHAKGAVLAQR
jgi:tetratricopeptide (TPR) repeat protein